MCGLTISQGDFVSASIEAELKEEVYVEMLEGIPGMQYVGTDGQRRVCRVNQSFFGAHQSSARIGSIACVITSFRATRQEPTTVLRATTMGLRLKEHEPLQRNT